MTGSVLRKVDWYLSIASEPDGLKALLFARVTYRDIEYQGMGATPEEALDGLLHSLGAVKL